MYELFNLKLSLVEQNDNYSINFNDDCIPNPGAAPAH